MSDRADLVHIGFMQVEGKVCFVDYKAAFHLFDQVRELVKNIEENNTGHTQILVIWDDEGKIMVSKPEVAPND